MDAGWTSDAQWDIGENCDERTIVSDQNIPPDGGQHEAPGTAGGPPSYGQGPQGPGQNPYGPGSTPPGQPGYGAPGQYGQQPGQPGYGQPQYGQGQNPMPPYPGQPGQYGGPSYGQPGGPQGPDYGPVAQAQSGLVQIPGLGTVKVATLGSRALARLIDSVILYILVWILWAVILGGASAAVTNDDGTVSDAAAGGILGALFGAFVITIVLTIAYEVVLTAIKGQTVGKMIMGIKVVRSRDGQLPGFGPSFMRWLLPIIGYAVCYVGAILVYLAPLFDSSGRVQGWHDKAANTLVIALR